MLVPDADELNFYPRPRVEGDIGPIRLFDWMRQFLPTPSRRGRPLMIDGGFGETYFYPRPRVEGDLSLPATAV